MIGHLKGKLSLVEKDNIVVDVGGVGFLIRPTASVIGALPSLGTEFFLYTYTHVREDHLELFGFKTLEELKAFRVLIKVSGIGPSVALTIISTLKVSELQKALQQGDITLLCRVNGIGKKTAGRMILELKGQLPLMEEAGAVDSEYSQLVSALESLGYKRGEIEIAVSKVAQNYSAEQEVTVLIKKALQYLSTE